MHTTNKTHLSLAVGLALLSFSQVTYAACPTASANSGVTVNTTGDNCSYSGASYANTVNNSAVVDISNGSSVTFTEPDVTLHKTSGGKSEGTYAAIFLRRETDPTKTNQAVFDGNLTVNAASSSSNPRDVILSGGSNLLIKGDLSLNHTHMGGGGIVVNADAWIDNSRDKTAFKVEGDTKINVQNSGSTRAVHVGNGSATFAGKVDVNFSGGNGRVFWVTNNNTNSIVKGGLTFEKDVHVTTSGGGNISTLTTDAKLDSVVNFNGNLTINNSGTYQVFDLNSATTNLNGNTTITTDNGPAIKMSGNAKLNNNGILTVSSKDGIGIIANPASGGTVQLHNGVKGIINQANGVGRNLGEGLFKVINDGKLTSANADVFSNLKSGLTDITNNGTLSGSLNNVVGGIVSTVNLSNNANGTWTNSSGRDSSLNTIVNLGTIAFAPADLSVQPARTISITKYSGGGTVQMNTLWNDDATAGNNGTTVSDKLVIDTIDAKSGVTTVKINAANIGSITPKASDIYSGDVIEVTNAHVDNMFVGTAATLGTQQAQLAKNGNNYRWTLKADNGTSLVNPDAVSYLLNTSLSLGMGSVHLGRLHQRIGGEYHNTTQASGSHNRVVWTRLIGNHDRIQGEERFGASSKVIGWQIGGDVDQGQTAAGSRYHSGIMLGYSHGTHHLYDKYRSVNGVVSSNKYVGQSHSDMVSLGGYHTRYSATGAYLDLVGQISWLQHRHSQAKQQGVATALSAEVGKPYALSDKWHIEPQAQLVYQYQHLNGTTDNLGRRVHSNNTHRLTARVGGRLLWQSGNNQVYLTANLMRPFGSTKIGIDGETLSENFNTWNAEVGLGTQWQIAPKFHVYADARYVHSLGNGNRVWRSSDARTTGYNANVGVHFAW